MPLFDPDPQQRAALEHARGTLLLTGGPGSGKTATLVERFARLVEAGADPERVVLFTLSRDGARTVREAILARLARSLPDIPALTFHSFALRVLGASYASLAYPEPPRLLTAPEQYGRVADLLSAEDPSLWPSLGRYLGLRRLRREVADFVLRAQERLLDPPAAEARALERDREDLTEVARFYGRYLDVTQAANEVDFAGLLMQALFVVAREGAGMDQVLVDDFQDVTPAGSGIVRALAERAESTTIAADPDGHVFSFRGGTLEPLAAVIEDADVHRVSLEGSHRLPGQLRALCRELSEERRTDDLQVDGWRFAQPAQEADAVARALLREHMDGAVPWGRMAVIVRRYRDYLPVLRRSFQHHGVPYLAVGEASAIASEAAVRPVVTLLRFALHPDRREELVEELLVSPVGALHPHDVRALRRAAKTAKPAASVLAVVEEPPSSLPEELRTRLAGIVALVDEAADRAARLAPDEVFQWLWERLPYLSGLVEEAEGSGEANRHLDAVDAFAASLARFAERRPGAPILDYLDAVEQVEFGADPFTPAVERTPEAVRVLTAHGAHGKEFDVAFVVGCLEGEFPRLAAPRPMVTLDDLDRERSPRDRYLERFGEERALFRLAVSRAPRVVLTTSETRDSRRPRTPTRFLPARCWGDPPVSQAATLADAEAQHRRALVDEAERPSVRLASLAALAASPARPETWWNAAAWTEGPALHPDGWKTSYSRLSDLDNCGLQYLLDSELGLDYAAGPALWLGAVVHEVIELAWTGEIERTRQAMEAKLDDLWRSDVFPGRAVEHQRRRDASRMFERLEEHLDNVPTHAERGFEFEFEGVTFRGKIDAIFVMPQGVRIVDYKTGRYPIALYEVEENLQLGIYLLALLRDPDLQALGNPYKVELIYLGGDQKALTTRPFTPTREHVPKVEARLRDMLTLIRQERFAPNPEANCHFCNFKSICPLWAEGAEVQT